jgi:hypothetical protein
MWHWHPAAVAHPSGCAAAAAVFRARLSVFVNNPAQARHARLGVEVVRIQDPRMSIRWAPGKMCRGRRP